MLLIIILFVKKIVVKVNVILNIFCKKLKIKNSCHHHLILKYILDYDKNFANCLNCPEHCENCYNLNIVIICYKC